MPTPPYLAAFLLKLPFEDTQPQTRTQTQAHTTNTRVWPFGKVLVASPQKETRFTLWGLEHSPNTATSRKGGARRCDALKNAFLLAPLGQQSRTTRNRHQTSVLDLDQWNQAKLGFLKKGEKDSQPRPSVHGQTE